MDFEKLCTDRMPFRQVIIDTIGSDLNGYILEDVTIDYLEQTPKENYDPSNVSDVGYRKNCANHFWFGRDFQ